MSAYPKDVCLMIITIIGLKTVVSDKEFRKVVFPFLLIVFLLTNISSLYLLTVKGVSFVPLAKRLIIQSFRFLLSVLEMYLGFSFLNYIKPESFISIQYFLLRLMIAAGIYQFIAYHVGAPFWGIAMARPIIARSVDYGIRPNSLIGEPKTFAIFSVIALSFFIILYLYKRVTLTSSIFWLTLSVFCFLRTESGNGILGLGILLVVRFLTFRINYYLKFSICGLAIWGAFLVFSQPELFFSRNLKVLVAFANLDFSNLLYMTDDLILLPILALIGNKICILFGFGYGLLTFYAKEYMEFSSWLIKFAGDRYSIDSNVAFLGVICNYGVVLIFAACALVVSGKKKVELYCKDENIQIISSFLFNCFFLGLFVTPKVFMYFALGFFLRMNSFLARDQFFKEESVSK